jgi:large subunit ribosomal protein L25
MSETEVLHATVRQGLGTRASRRLRQQGQIPAVLYGHGKESVNLAIPHGEVEAMIRHGSKMVSIQGEVSSNAFVKEVQWDPLGMEVLHLDLTRVFVGEAVDVVVPVELVGEAPGAKQGGRVEQVTHEVEISCPAEKIPDKFEVRINSLELGQSITIDELELPEGAKMLSEVERVLVTCEEVIEVEEAEVTTEVGAEPEVIGREEETEENAD